MSKTHRTRRLPVAWIALVLLVAASPQALHAAEPSGRLVVQSWALNSYKAELDGQWQGIRLASDGNCYFASSTHSGRHGAAFFRYDPRAKEIKLLCDDITKVCGEDPAVNPQGKLHSDMVEAGGWLYFATHFSSEAPGASRTYTGAHVLGYELATGRFRDLGVAHPGYTCYSGVAVDAERKRLFVHTTPISDEQVKAGGFARLYQIDLATGQKKEAAALKPGNHVHNFYFFVDRRGDCWFTLGQEQGTLFCLRAETGKLDRWENALPLRYLVGEEKVAPDAQQGDRWWLWAQPLGDGERCVFADTNDGMLWTFDAGKAADLPRAFRPVHHVGPTDLGMAVAGGRVYYIQKANRQPGPKARVGEQGLHLLSVSLDPAARPAVVDHGLVVDQDGRQPWRIQSLGASPEGLVFMTGDWHLKPGEKGTMRYSARGGKDAWDALRRGQFFSVADVGKDLRPQPGAGTR